MSEKLNVPVVAGIAVGVLTCLFAFGFLPTLVLVAIAGGGWFFYKNKSEDSASTTPAPPARPAATPALDTAPAGPAAPVGSAAPAAPAAAPAQGASVPTTAAEIIDAIRQDCIDQGFFLKHKVTTSKNRRGGAQTVTMTAVSRTDKLFTVEVEAVESQYGLNVQARWVEQGTSLSSAVMQQGTGFGGAMARGAAAGKRARADSRRAELDLEMTAFRQQVLAKYGM